jgi:hypothetical protein
MALVVKRARFSDRQGYLATRFTIDHAYPFGQHKGTRIRYLPTSFLREVVRVGLDNAYLLAACREALRLREGA